MGGMLEYLPMFIWERMYSILIFLPLHRHHMKRAQKMEEELTVYSLVESYLITASFLAPLDQAA